MPYFQRKPIESLEKILRSNDPFRGLPSRGSWVGPGTTAHAAPVSPDAEAANIIQLADAALASERPDGVHPNELIKPVSASTRAGPVSKDPNSTPAGTPVLEPLRDTADLMVEPAPVLSAGPVAPNGTAEAIVSLINEEEQQAQIEFFGTDLIGQDGALIHASNLAFQPRKLTLEAGKSGEVKVQVAIPAHTPDGIYSGLIRASKPDYLHAVLVVQVNEP